ncbi:transmembrane protein 168-like isoform X1 [Branchiostoma floridae]|uniref:Transmembrane protein 168 n=1 Tax=Branchiostoma floridae TaxID=7739 RepID=A0A9J7L3Y3_BRAFL|nr:transmembrane protein 168-like isoform X1 [Branchiostoma floridae]
MNRSVRYFFSHASATLMIKMKEIRKMHFSIRYLGFLPSLVLLVAISLGLYTRWEATEEVFVLVVALGGLFVFAIAMALHYYFSMEYFSESLAHLWFGCLLGMMAFTENESFRYDEKEEVMNILLMTSVGLSLFWAMVERTCNYIKYTSNLLTNSELMETAGFATATILLGQKWADVCFLSVAFALGLIAMRKKALLAVPNFTVFLALSIAIFFPTLKKTINPYAASCFAGRLCIAPLLDIYFSNLTTVERWQWYIFQSKHVKRLVILVTVVVDITFMVFSGMIVRHFQELFFVIPGFVIFGILWICFHIVFIVTCWVFSRKLNECVLVYKAYGEDTKNMTRIMASKGVRHFSQISERLALCTIFSTWMLAAVSWQATNTMFFAFLFIVLPVEITIHGLLHDLGRSVGGTCIGYAMVAPSNSYSPEGDVLLLPTSALQDYMSQSTDILNSMQRFFTHHLVETFGCDYSTSGLTLESVESKLKALFERHTPDGPRFDSYVVYYSGHMHPGGDLALSGLKAAGDTTPGTASLKLDTLLDWWKETNSDAGSRLIIILDTDNGHHWVRQVRRLDGVYVAIQSYQQSKRDDPEMATQVGEFTKEWVAYNCSDDIGTNWAAEGRTIKAVYAVSRCWTDFHFHSPSEEDVAQHWESHFPRATRPLVRVATWCQGGEVELLCCCDWLFKCLKRKKMQWLPPVLLNTGHGFKLVRTKT